MDLRWLRQYECKIGGISAMTFEQVFDSLYTHCSDRSNTSKQVFNSMIKDLGLVGTSHLEQEALDIIRPYKQSGKHLENTAKALYTLLSTKPAEPENKVTWG